MGKKKKKKDENHLAWIWIQGHIQYISAMTTIIFIIGENHSVAFSTMINQGSRNWILLELNQSRKVEWLQVSIAEVFHESHSLFLQKKDDLNVKITQFLFAIF